MKTSLNSKGSRTVTKKSSAKQDAISILDPQGINNNRRLEPSTVQIDKSVLPK